MDVDEDGVLSMYINISTYRCMNVDEDGVLSMYMNTKMFMYRCMDVDGDGVLSMYELEYFYEEQLQRMEQLGIETLPFDDCLCQV